MSTIILKNQTAGQKTYGVVVVPASGQRAVSGFADVLRTKDTLFADIVSGDIIVNDGTSDLNADEGRSLIFNPLDEQPIYVRGTGALSLPAGTTAERPTVVVDGMIRYNSTTNKYEICDGTWKDVSVTSPKCDRQTAIATTGTSTAQTTYQDLDSMTLTTKNLGETGTYNISFQCTGSHTDKGDTGFVVNIGGVDEPVTERIIKLSTNDTDEVNMICQKSGLASGTIIKVAYKAVNTGTVDIGNRTLFIDGVPDSTVVA